MLMPYVPFTCSGCLQPLSTLKSMMQHEKIHSHFTGFNPGRHCIPIRFTIGASKEALLHVSACRQRLSINNHLQQGFLRCDNLKKKNVTTPTTPTTPPLPPPPPPPPTATTTTTATTAVTVSVSVTETVTVTVTATAATTLHVAALLGETLALWQWTSNHKRKKDK